MISEKFLMAGFNFTVGFKANWKCEMPGCDAVGRDLHPHHVFSKKNGNIAYDPDAAIWLCPACHAEAHANRPAFLEKIISAGVRTQEWLDELIRKKNRIVDRKSAEFREFWKDKLMWGRH